MLLGQVHSNVHELLPFYFRVPEAALHMLSRRTQDAGLSAVQDIANMGAQGPRRLAICAIQEVKTRVKRRDLRL